jgi:hypothetical protein
MGNKYVRINDRADNGSEQRREKAAANIGIAHHLVRAVDLLDLGGIFAMNGFGVLKLLFEHLARYIMLPIAAASGIIMSVFAWLEFGLSKDKDVKGFLLGRAITETIGATAVSVAVIGGLVSAAFTFGPYIFAAWLGYKALFHFVSAVTFTAKAYQNRDNKKFNKCKERAIDNWAGFIVGALAAATVVTVIIFLQSALWVMGATAAALGAGYAVYKSVVSFNEKRKKAKAASVEINDHGPDHDTTSTPGMGVAKINAALNEDRHNAEVLAHASGNVDVSHIGVGILKDEESADVQVKADTVDPRSTPATDNSDNSDTDTEEREYRKTVFL